MVFSGVTGWVPWCDERVSSACTRRNAGYLHDSAKLGTARLAELFGEIVVQNTSEAAMPDYIALTSDVVSAYVSNNAVSQADLPGLIGTVHAALSGALEPAKQQEELTPPVPIKSTIRPDYIISLEDGRRYKSMKRHLAGRGLTPEQYRQKWGLRPDYPMVSPNYSKARSELAKALGLGQARKGRSSKSAAKKAKRG
jgi:predicted transcriptional regulator